MQTTGVLLLIFTLLPCIHGDGDPLECAHCELGEPSCLLKKNCTDAAEICVSLEVANGTGRGTYKGCIAPSSCSPVALTISSASGRRVQSNMACCNASGCNDQLTLGVPPSGSLNNGVNCPACENWKDVLCERQADVSCTGAEEKCIALVGASIGSLNHSFSLRGCATPSACQLKKDDLMSFGGDVYMLTQNVICTDKGVLKAFPSLATVFFQFMVGVSLANVLF